MFTETHLNLPHHSYYFCSARCLFKVVLSNSLYRFSVLWGMRVCSGRTGPWKVLVILRTVVYEQSQATTHPWPLLTQVEGYAFLMVSYQAQLIHSKGEFVSAKVILYKVAKLPDIGTEVLEISTKMIVVKIFCF